MKSAKKVFIIENQIKKNVGYVVDERFISLRSEALHAYRGGSKTLRQARTEKSLQWGIDKQVCESLPNHNVKTILIVTKKDIYSIPVSEYLTNPRSILREFDGYKPQYFMPISEFTKETISLETCKELEELGIIKKCRNK